MAVLLLDELSGLESEVATCKEEEVDVGPAGGACAWGPLKLEISDAHEPGMITDLKPFAWSQERRTPSMCINQQNLETA